MTIAIVDDDAVTTAILKGLAGGRGTRAVETFTSPLKALEFLEEHPMLVIVIDCSMPELDGIELTRRLRLSPLHPTTPIIMVTGAENEDARRLAEEAGVTHFLRKPVKTQEFKALLAQVLPPGEYLNRREADLGPAPGTTDRRRGAGIQA